MADQKKHANLFLHPDSLKEAVELMFFAYRDFTEVADSLLAAKGLGRAHHRVIHFVADKPGLTVSALLDTLQITKQSLSRVLKQLVDEGYIDSHVSEEDARRRELRLTDKGQALQRELARAQHELILSAFEQVDGEAVDGFRSVMLGMIKKDQDRRRFERKTKKKRS